GSKIFVSIPGTATGTWKPKCGSVRICADFSVPSNAAESSARVTLIGMREPTPNAPPVQPVFTSQQSTLYFPIRSRSRLPYSVGWRGMNGAPKQVENVACGSLPSPFSVPATFAVYPDRKWYMAWLGVSLAIGGITPKASAVSMTMFLG